jgi:thiazole synthase ThiGH ThiG subunit
MEWGFDGVLLNTAVSTQFEWRTLLPTPSAPVAALFWQGQ